MHHINKCNVISSLKVIKTTENLKPCDYKSKSRLMIKMGRIESTPTITVIRDLVMRNRRSRMISNVCVVYAITLLCLCGPGQVHCFSVGGVQEQPFVVDATIPDRQTNEVSFNENEVDEVPKTCER